MTNHSSIHALAGSTAGQLSALERRLGPIEYQPIGSLAAYEKNPRRHPEKQIIKLMASISEFGFALPVLVDTERTIIAGHARIEAARRLDISEVPVLVATDWSKMQVRAYRVADNRHAELATWDDELLAIELSALIEIDEVSIEVLGWETAEIDLITEADSKTSNSTDPADESPELPAAPVSRPGDLWLLGRHRLLCGSSLEASSWECLMDGRAGAMVFTDAPYNVPVSGHVCGLGKVQHGEFAMASGEMSKAEFTTFLGNAIKQLTANVRDGAVLDLCMDWRHLPELLSALEANDLSLLNLCVWNKNNGGMGSLYRSKHELVLIAKKGKAPHTNNVELGRHGRYRTNVWDYAGVNSFGKGRMTDLADHPTIKPVALVADAIRDVTRPGEIVLDAFMGSGTTILAAERTKRWAYGIEIDPGYIDVALRRWTAMTGEEAKLAETGETFAQVAARRGAEAASEPREPLSKLD
jgi:DNA modification methylase